MYEIFLVLFLIIPLERIPPEPGMEALKFLWEFAELATPKSTRNYQGRDYQQELFWTRQALLDTYLAPAREDLEMFKITAEDLNKLLWVNAEFRREIQIVIEGLPEFSRGPYRAALMEAEQQYQALSELSTALTSTMWLSTRRMALKEYRRLVGLQRYYQGFIPPCLPTWRLPFTFSRPASP